MGGGGDGVGGQGDIIFVSASGCGFSKNLALHAKLKKFATKRSIFPLFGTKKQVLYLSTIVQSWP